MNIDEELIKLEKELANIQQQLQQTEQIRAQLMGSMLRKQGAIEFLKDAKSREEKKEVK